VRVQRLDQETVWKDLGEVDGAEMNEAVEQVADGAGIYRCRVADDDPWRFFYVDEGGSVIDSGAVSRL
jgi:hypothetical protein